MTHIFHAALSFGRQPYLEVECELDCHIDDDRGTARPYLAVDRVAVNGVALPLPYRQRDELNTFDQNFAAQIIEQAEKCPALFEQVRAFQKEAA